MKIPSIVFWILAIGAVAGLVFLFKSLTDKNGSNTLISNTPLGYTPVVVQGVSGTTAPSGSTTSTATIFDTTYTFDSTAWTGGNVTPITSGPNAGRRGDFYQPTTEFAELTVNVPSAGSYNLKVVGFVAGSTAVTMQAGANGGAAVELPYGAGATESTARITLNAGVNRIRIDRKSAAGNIYQLANVRLFA